MAQFWNPAGARRGELAAGLCWLRRAEARTISSTDSNPADAGIHQVADNVDGDLEVAVEEVLDNEDSVVYLAVELDLLPVGGEVGPKADVVTEGAGESLHGAVPGQARGRSWPVADSERIVDSAVPAVLRRISM